MYGTAGGNAVSAEDGADENRLGVLTGGGRTLLLSRSGC